MVSNDTYYIGVDPGTVNLGFAAIEDNKEHPLVSKGMIDPSKLTIKATVELLFNSLPGGNLVFVVERYVAYNGKLSEATERILMIIGAIVFEAQRRGHEVLMFRAIDWKPEIAKYLFKNHSFKNPSTALDKKFSVAAAKALTGVSDLTTHTADAICLAFKGKLSNELVQQTAPQNG